MEYLLAYIYATFIFLFLKVKRLDNFYKYSEIILLDVIESVVEIDTHFFSSLISFMKPHLQKKKKKN